MQALEYPKTNSRNGYKEELYSIYSERELEKDDEKDLLQDNPPKPSRNAMKVASRMGMSASSQLASFLQSVASPI